MRRSLVFAAALGACVPSRTELRAPIDRDLAAKQLVPATDVTALLAKPLDRDAAVRIALAHSPRLAATLDELGIAGGELASALGLGPLHVDAQLRFGGGKREYELDALQSVHGLVTAPRRRAAAHAELVAARARAEAAAIALAARAEIAFDSVIAAQQDVELRHTAFDAADAAATIRERMFSAGNTTLLAQARDRDAREQARIELARSEAAVEVARERLNALLGLSGPQTKWTTTGTLAEPPADAPALDDLETTAVTASLDLAGGRARGDAADNRAGAATLSAFLPEIGIGVAVADDHDGVVGVGPAIRIGLPLFDQRAGARARADAEAARAGHELVAIAVELRARARAVRVAALAAHAEARHLKDVVLPLRQQIVDETLLHYNAMDADPFALIVARQALVTGGHDYLMALQRYAAAISEATALRRGALLDPDPDHARSMDDGHP